MLHKRLCALVVGAVVLLPSVRGQEAGEKGLPKPPTKDFTGQVPHQVLEVQAGNKLIVRLSAEATTIRLIGTYVPGKGPEADAARAYATRLLTGESVYVEYEPDWPLRDREERVWAYVYRAPDGLFVNLELIRQGYAKVSAAGPFEHQELLRSYERLARKNRKGLWSPREVVATHAEPTSGPAGEEARAAAAGQEQAGGDIIVYVTKHGRKYHRKDCQYVRNGAIALTLKEARATGYTPCSRCKPPK